MSHFGDYMDGVPVKISEKYKPPPRIDLPYSVNDSVSRAKALVENVHYNFNFETNILAKLTELRRAKETIRNERLHRLQLIEEAKQIELDRIAAAETEAKMKQLSVSEVSYPSTEEISEISPDETADKCSDGKNQTSSADKFETDDQQLQPAKTQTSYYETYDNQTHVNGQHGYSTANDTFLRTESRPEILKPIPLLANTGQPNLLDDPDPLREIRQNLSLFNSSQLRMFYKKNNIEKLTFSDFENDTSSPFDNMELKTINDFELLAQALESQKDQKGGNTLQVEYGTNNQQDSYLPTTSFYPSNSIHSVSYNYNEHPIVNHTASTYSSPQAYVSSNGYYHTPIETVNNCDNITPASVSNLYVPAYSNYYTPSNTCQNSQSIDTNFYLPQNDLNYIIASKNIGTNENYNTSQHSEPYQYYDYGQQNSNYNTYTNVITRPVRLESTTSQHPQQVPQSIIESGSIATVSSRSRSVPDIMKELDEEINSARLKCNQRSSNSSPAPCNQPSRKQSTSGIPETKTVPKVIEQLPNPYETLSPELQKMCKNISSMGFPLSRVARISLSTGENDKKIIECLLAIGQLMDLGFSEKQVVTALIKNDFNRDKALDDLVS